MSTSVQPKRTACKAKQITFMLQKQTTVMIVTREPNQEWFGEVPGSHNTGKAVVTKALGHFGQRVGRERCDD